MKLRNLILILLVVIASACGSSDNSTEIRPSVAVLTGMINHPTESNFNINVGDERYVALVDPSSGTFTLDIALDSAGFHSLTYNNELARIYLIPGDTLHLSLDAAEFDESLHYEGDNAGYNNYLAAAFLEKESWENQHPMPELFMRESQDFKAAIDSLYELRLALLTQSAETNAFAASFTHYESENLKYERAAMISNYPRGANYYQKRNDISVPDSFFVTMPLEAPELIGCEAYESYVILKANKAANESLSLIPQEEQNYETYTLAKMAFITENLKNQSLIDLFLGKSMREIIDYSGTSDLTNCLTYFETHAKDSVQIANMANEMADWKKIWAGNPAPGFSYLSYTGDTVSLESLLGKVVYIDVWATWCGPCKMEIPHLKDLEHDLSGYDVAFISLSVDTDTAQWRKMVGEKMLGGIQLISEDAWNTSVTKDYHINSIPRFLLIDKAGKIIDANAPRPSSGDEIRQLILNAAEKEDIASVE